LQKRHSAGILMALPPGNIHVTVPMRGSEHRASIGTHRSVMISRWANREAGARKAAAVAVACLFMLQSLVLAAGLSERGKHQFDATTLIAKAFCGAESNDEAPAERRAAHPKCCGLCSANRANEDLGKVNNVPDAILEFIDNVSNSTVVYKINILVPNSAIAQILSRSPRAPPYIS
jgi:hypothetical protein